MYNSASSVCIQGGGGNVRRNFITNQDMPLSQILGLGTQLEVFLEGVAAFDGGGGEGG